MYKKILWAALAALFVGCYPGKHVGKPREYVIYSNVQRVQQKEGRAEIARYRRCQRLNKIRPYDL